MGNALRNEISCIISHEMRIPKKLSSCQPKFCFMLTLFSSNTSLGCLYTHHLPFCKDLYPPSSTARFSVHLLKPPGGRGGDPWEGMDPGADQQNVRCQPTKKKMVRGKLAGKSSTKMKGDAFFG